MSEALFAFIHHVSQLSESIRDSLSKTPYSTPESHNVSVKSILQSTLPNPSSNLSTHELRQQIKNLSLCLSLLASSEASKSDLVTWIPKDLALLAKSTFRELSKTYSGSLIEGKSQVSDQLGWEVPEEKSLVVELMPEVLPSLKDKIKESAISKDDDCDDISAASARTPVAYAILAAHQFRWLVTQVDYPHLGSSCSLVVPCALTALDHWSPEVKGQGMISFIHLGRNVSASELSWCEDVILDACCQNIASDDMIWQLVVEMSVLIVTCTQRSNPRSLWYEKLLNEMLSHLERLPRNKERRIAWLEYVEPLFEGIGLVLLAHFRRIFPLFFQWIHADDDPTVLLVLKRVHTVLKLTWVRNTPYVERLVNELASLYKEAAMRKARKEIRKQIVEILTLLQQCKGLQFETTWDKHRNDPNLTGLGPSFSRSSTMGVQ